VIDDLGRLIGIVTRSDLLKAHLRPDDELREDVCDGMLAAYFADSVTGVQVQVGDGVVTLTGRVAAATTAEAVAWVTRQVPGVVSVVNAIEWAGDDRKENGAGS
jgi:osmotically-inducible protein OsmY